jgi:hypothetical protein
MFPFDRACHSYAGKDIRISATMLIGYARALTNEQDTTASRRVISAQHILY